MGFIMWGKWYPVRNGISRESERRTKVAELTPMMQQYMETKKEYSDCILFYRLGRVALSYLIAAAAVIIVTFVYHIGQTHLSAGRGENGSRQRPGVCRV